MITRSLSLDYARILFLVMNPLILKVVFLECRTHDNFQWSSSVRLACVMISSTFWLPVLVSGTDTERERGNYHLLANLYFIQHKYLEIVCSPEVTF